MKKSNANSVGEITNEEEALAAVKWDGRALEFVPPEHKTAELCLRAVTRSGWVLKYVPLEHKTTELCLEAVKQSGWALQYVPWGQIDLSVPAKAELCLEAVKNMLESTFEEAPEKRSIFTDVLDFF